MGLDINALESAIRAEELIRNNTPIVIASAVGRPVIQRAFNMQNVEIITRKEDYQVPPGQERDKEFYTSALGTPILADLKLDSVQYTDNAGNNFITPEVRLETVLLTINQTKNIVKTQVQGGDGTVKEYIGMGDYYVTINGIFTAPNGQFPKQDLIDFKKVLVAPVRIPVVCWWLQIFDINYIVIDGYDIAQEEGGYSMQPFSVSASSDKPITLRFI